jgi:hypothetical protein
MAKRWLYVLSFWLVETVIILGSIVVVVCFYLPFVALKAAWVLGRSRLKRAKVDGAESSAPAG